MWGKRRRRMGYSLVATTKWRLYLFSFRGYLMHDHINAYKKGKKTRRKTLQTHFVCCVWVEASEQAYTTHTIHTMIHDWIHFCACWCRSTQYTMTKLANILRCSLLSSSCPAHCVVNEITMYPMGASACMWVSEWRLMKQRTIRMWCWCLTSSAKKDEMRFRFTRNTHRRRKKDGRSDRFASFFCFHLLLLGHLFIR